MSGTRDRILDALETVLDRHGSSGATLEAVAAEAGVSKGGLLYHYGTKEALYQGLLDRLHALDEAEVARWSNSGEGVVRSFLEESTEAEGPYTRTLLAALRLLGTPGVDVEGAVAASVEGWSARIGEHVEDPVLARLVALVGDGLYLHALVGAPLGELDRAVLERLVDTVEAAPAR